ncbi:MAG TPA: sulfite exporter TauE/SafE family protein [Polyangia bacterium]|nr:sulfite exporter TauE/SafE family protein [Polyangia bacterium]
MELRHLFLFLAAAVAGAVNAVAGGGTLLSFPAAIAWGLPATVANATNSVALSPAALASAWAYRRELAAEWRLAAALAGPALVGGFLGAFILRHTSQRTFDVLVPWLVLGASLLILLQGVLRKRTEPRAVATSQARGQRLGFVMLCQLGVGIYGGYFGAAMGIIMLAFLALVLPDDIQRRNALKNFLGVLINGTASIYFLASGLVSGRAALIMLGGGIAGGFVGGRLARRASARVVRNLVVAIGLSLSALLAYRAWTRQ